MAEKLREAMNLSEPKLGEALIVALVGSAKSRDAVMHAEFASAYSEYCKGCCSSPVCLFTNISC
jgi:hypothetical protein